MAYEPKMNWQLDDTVTEQDMNRIEQGLKDAYENSMTSPPPERVNLRYGLQVVDAKRTAPLENVCIKGRTLVNLLGRDGNCESLSPFTSSPPNVYQGTAALDSANKVYGNNGIKISIGNGYTLATIAKSNIPCEKNKFYVAIAEVKNGNASNGIRVVLSGGNYGPTIPYQTSTTTFVLSFSKLASRSSTSLQVDIGVSGSAGQYAYVDGIRLYEITEAEYNAIDSMTPEQIAAKWPYVDDMKNIYSPYMIRYGENLLPPFTEWNVTAGSDGTPKMSVDDPYSVNLIADQSGQAVYVEIPVVPNTTYTLSLPSLPVNGYIGFNSFDANMQFVNAYGGFTSNLSKTITTEANVRYLKVIFGNNTFGAGIYKFIKPMLNLGPKAKPFKPRNEDYLFFPNVQLASKVDGTVYDTLYQRDGKYWKLARLKTIDLDGSLPWLLHDESNPGYKQVRSDNLLSNNIDGTKNVVKFDGKIIHRFNGVLNKADLVYDGTNANTSNIYLSISNADSGWGDSYSPSNDEINAYFNGWKMYDTGSGNTALPYNRTDGTYKGWCYVGKQTNGTGMLPTTRANGFKPYKLQYQLNAPTVEEIIVEGSITLNEGLNKVEVGNGMIVREKANPFFDSIINKFYINAHSSKSPLRGGVSKYIAIYRNNLTDKTWTCGLGGAENRNYAEIDAANYDTSAAYTITYVVLNQYGLTCNLTSIQGEYSINLRAAVDALAINQADVVARLSMLQILVGQKGEDQWITPTLLNGWVNANYGTDEPVKYMKDSLGLVHIIGLAKGGTIGQAIFKLPAGYRPKGTLTFTAVSHDGNSEVPCRIIVFPTGDVMPLTGSSITWYTLSIPPFLAEQ